MAAAGSLAARVLDWMSRFSLRRANKVIALDRFMRDRIVAKGIAPEKVAVIPPWSHDAEVKFDPAGRERFRKAHGLEGKFVVMYSGNHSPCHPLDTVLAAAREMEGEPEVVFCFVGGGSEWRRIKEKAEMLKAEMLKVEGNIEHRTSNIQHPIEEGRPGTSKLPSSVAALRRVNEHRASSIEHRASSIEHRASSIQHPASSIEHRASNVLCLPYQPLDQLSGSLSAADLHVVVMGNEFVGLVHPCKIYNVLSVGAPVLYIGPRPSHLSELLAGLNHEYPCAAVGHGEVGRVVEEIERMRRLGAGAGRGVVPERVKREFSKEAALGKLVGEMLKS